MKRCRGCLAETMNADLDQDGSCRRRLCREVTATLAVASSRTTTVRPADTGDPVARLRADWTAIGITWNADARAAADAVATHGWAHAHSSGALRPLYARAGRP